jgi:hypothetical protein
MQGGRGGGGGVLLPLLSPAAALVRGAARRRAPRGRDAAICGVATPLPPLAGGSGGKPPGVLAIIALSSQRPDAGEAAGRPAAHTSGWGGEPKSGEPLGEAVKSSRKLTGPEGSTHKADEHERGSRNWARRAPGAKHTLCIAAASCQALAPPPLPIPSPATSRARSHQPARAPGVREGNVAPVPPQAPPWTALQVWRAGGASVRHRSYRPAAARRHWRNRRRRNRRLSRPTPPRACPLRRLQLLQ